MATGFGGQTSILRVKTQRERTIFFAAAGLALALLVVALVVVNYKHSPARVDGREVSNSSVVASPAVGMVTLYAPERLIPRNSQLSADKFQFKEIYWPRNDVPEGAIRDLSECIGMYAKEDLRPGLPIQRTALSTESSHFSLPVTPGMRAVSIEVDATSGLEGHALPGSHVDVVLTYQDEDNKLVSQVVVENARVLSAGGDTTPMDERSPVERAATNMARTITLEVTLEDALTIQTARQKGRLSLIMRSAGDNKPAPSGPVGEGDIAKRGGITKKPAKDVTCQDKGKMRMGGREFVITCDGRIVPLEDPSEP